MNLNGVGKNLQDHLFTIVGPFIFNESVPESLLITRDANLEALIRYTHNATGQYYKHILRVFYELARIHTYTLLIAVILNLNL